MHASATRIADAVSATPLITHSPARSPVHRSLPPVATRGPGAGTFSNILLAQGAGQQ
jgi:hypothetical protein